MHGFTKALAQEVIRYGVTVNSVSPGYVGTELVMAIRKDVREKIIVQARFRRGIIGLAELAFLAVYRGEATSATLDRLGARLS